MIEGRCLCGAHHFSLEGPLELSHHCHCGYCRKQHGTAFASLVGVVPERLTWTRGDTIAYESSPGMHRESCATCGTPLPQEIEGLPMFVPAGCLGEFPERMEFHIFAGSKAPWYEIGDGLPAFDTYPPGVDGAPQPTIAPRDPEGGTRGSCLCGDVRFALDGPAITARNCHCTRCRRARGAAHASNLIVALDTLRFTAGEEKVRCFKLPEAKFFTQCFCPRCGGKAPTVSEARGFALIAMGSLDDPPPIGPQEHIFTADIPGWSGIYDALPQHEGAPPPTKEPR